MCHYIRHRIIRSKVLAHAQWLNVSSSFIKEINIYSCNHLSSSSSLLYWSSSSLSSSSYKTSWYSTLLIKYWLIVLHTSIWLVFFLFSKLQLFYYWIKANECIFFSLMHWISRINKKYLKKVNSKKKVLTHKIKLAFTFSVK